MLGSFEIIEEVINSVFGRYLIHPACDNTLIGYPSFYHTLRRETHRRTPRFNDTDIYTYAL